MANEAMAKEAMAKEAMAKEAMAKEAATVAALSAAQAAMAVWPTAMLITVREPATGTRSGNPHYCTTPTARYGPAHDTYGSFTETHQSHRDVPRTHTPEPTGPRSGKGHSQWASG